MCRTRDAGMIKIDKTPAFMKLLFRWWDIDNKHNVYLRLSAMATVRQGWGRLC